MMKRRMTYNIMMLSMLQSTMSSLSLSLTHTLFIFMDISLYVKLLIGYFSIYISAYCVEDSHIGNF